MVTIPAFSAVVDLTLLAAKVLKKDGHIRLGMFIYALKHGSKNKYGSLLRPHREHFAGLNDEQLFKLYEVVLCALAHTHPRMTCGIEGWPLEIGYTTTPVDCDGPHDLRRIEQRKLEMKLGRHPDARTSTRGTQLPGTIWYAPKPNAEPRAFRQAA